MLHHHNQRNMCDSCSYSPVVDAPMIPFDDTLYKIRAYRGTVWWYLSRSVTSPLCSLSSLHEMRVIFVCFRRQCILIIHITMYVQYRSCSSVLKSSREQCTLVYYLQ